MVATSHLAKHWASDIWDSSRSSRLIERMGRGSRRKEIVDILDIFDDVTIITDDSIVIMFVFI